MTDVTQKEIGKLKCMLQKLQKKSLSLPISIADVAGLQNQLSATTNTLTSDNTNLNTFQELVDAIEALQASVTTPISPATATPLATNHNTTPLGDVGASVKYAREDHIHPKAVRLVVPATPVLVASGAGFTIDGQSGTVVVSNSEMIVYRILLQCTQMPSNEFSLILVPNLAGYQNPTTVITMMFRSFGMNASKPTPAVNMEAGVYYGNTIYLNDQVRTTVLAYQMSIDITYFIN